jgi:signal transduction histidine kinase
MSVLVLLGLAGWLVAAGLALAVRALRRRVLLSARAEHELRGPAAALELALTSMAREPTGRRHARALRAEVDRLRVGLADLAAARSGRRAPGRAAPVGLERMLRGAAAGWGAAADRSGRRVLLDWRAGDATVIADRGRLAQLFANLVANAVDHGRGPVEIRGRRVGHAVRVEVSDRGPARGGPRRVHADHVHGHGLPVAAAAAEEAGGTLAVESSQEATTVAVELPLAE